MNAASTTMRQVNIHGIDDVRVDQVPVPTCGDHDALVRVLLCGICGTDQAMIGRGGFMADDQGCTPLGHEMVGVVEKLGASVVDAGVNVGQRVVVNPLGRGAGELAIGCGADEGALCDVLLVRDVRPGSMTPVPDGASDHAATLTEPLSVARHAVNRAAPQPHETAVVMGVGMIGLGAVLWLARAGVTEIIAVDVSPMRLEQARRLGATGTVQVDGTPVGPRIAQLVGEQTVYSVPAADVDLWIDAAGAPAAINDAIAWSKLGARIVTVASHKKPVEVDFRRMLMSEITLVMSTGYPVEIPQVLADLPAVNDLVEPLVTHVTPIDDFASAYETFTDPTCIRSVVSLA